METELKQDVGADELRKRLKGIFSDAKLLSKEEIEQISHEMAVYKKRYGQDALNKRLFKEFGLE